MNFATQIRYVNLIIRCENIGARKSQAATWPKLIYLPGLTYLEHLIAGIETDLMSNKIDYVISSTQSVPTATTTAEGKLQQLRMKIQPIDQKGIRIRWLVSSGSMDLPKPSLLINLCVILRSVVDSHLWLQTWLLGRKPVSS